MTRVPLPNPRKGMKPLWPGGRATWLVQILLSTRGLGYRIRRVKSGHHCKRCGQTWRWPEDMARTGLCLACFDQLYATDKQEREAVESVLPEAMRSE